MNLGRRDKSWAIIIDGIGKEGCLRDRKDERKDKVEESVCKVSREH